MAATYKCRTAEQAGYLRARMGEHGLSDESDPASGSETESDRKITVRGPSDVAAMDVLIATLAEPGRGRIVKS